MDPRQQKTFIGIILIMLLGAAACCSLTVAIGAFAGYNEALETARAGPPDAGSPRGSDDEDLPEADAPPADEAELRQQFEADLLAGLADAGHPDFVFQPLSFYLTTDGGLLPVKDVYDEYELAEAEERPELIARSIRGFFPPEIPGSWSRAKPHVIATVRDRTTVEVLAIRAQMPLEVLQRPLSEGLVELVVYDGPDSMQYLNEAHLEAWGVTADEVFLQGRKQLAARSQEPFEEYAPGVYSSPWGDQHDIGRALLFETFRKLKLKGDPVIFLPNHDRLIVTGANDRQGLEAAGDFISQVLVLPRAHTGRGWRLTRTGLVPFVPPADNEILTVLRQEAAAWDANEQKGALDEKAEREGSDELFVATTLFNDDEQGRQRSYCVWTQGAVSLLPQTEFVVFVDLERPEAERIVAAGRWEDVMKRAGKWVTAAEGYWPARYQVSTFPDSRTLKAIGLDPAFAPEE
ncbi:MAG: hypothetical protein Q8K32_14495 [Archangium sp.]|nr:hypothetical protein [Archangium sp.]